MSFSKTKEKFIFAFHSSWPVGTTFYLGEPGESLTSNISNAKMYTRKMASDIYRHRNHLGLGDDWGSKELGRWRQVH